MKVQKHAISLACLAALGFAGSAQAVQVAGELLDVYGNLYPQFQMSSFSDTTTGALSTMNAGLVTPGNGNGAGKANITQVSWVQSFIGLKGQKAFGDVKAGYQIEVVTMANGTLPAEPTGVGAGRDAYVFVGSNMLGTLQMGEMDTIYKEFGDRVRLLGVSSSNFISTSGLVSGVTWKATGVGSSGNAGTATAPTNAAGGGPNAGVTTFNTRINGQLRWISPNWAGIEVGASFRPDPQRTATQDQSLMGAGIRWSNPTYYAGLGYEVHNDYHGFSGTNNATNAANVLNVLTVRSKDTATRLSFGYTAASFRLGADFSSLQYTEDGAVGKFESYKTTGAQITGEYTINPQIAIGANYAVGAAGTCTLVGGGTCTTDGQGGTLLSLGARYDFDKNVGLFAIYGLNTNNSTAVIAGSNTGGNVTNIALGLQVKF